MNKKLRLSILLSKMNQKRNALFNFRITINFEKHRSMLQNSCCRTYIWILTSNHLSVRNLMEKNKCVIFPQNCGDWRQANYFSVYAPTMMTAASSQTAQARKFEDTNRVANAVSWFIWINWQVLQIFIPSKNEWLESQAKRNKQIRTPKDETKTKLIKAFHFERSRTYDHIISNILKVWQLNFLYSYFHKYIVSVLFICGK